LVNSLYTFGYTHPDENVKKQWSNLYRSICEYVSCVNLETEIQLDEQFKHE